MRDGPSLLGFFACAFLVSSSLSLHKSIKSADFRLLTSRPTPDVESTAADGTAAAAAAAAAANFATRRSLRDGGLSEATAAEAPAAAVAAIAGGTKSTGGRGGGRDL